MKKNKQLALPVLWLLLLISFFLECRYGAVKLSLDEIISSLGNMGNAGTLTLNERIFLNIRLPRALLCIVTGAVLSAGGVLLQGLFRNPLIDPGLIGTCGGAAFGASLYIVLSGVLPLWLSFCGLPVFACAGAFLSTFLVMVLSYSRNTNKTSGSALLLTGVAISALFMSGVGFMSYIARDPQARSITFWSLGTLSGANWSSLILTTLVAILCILLALRHGKSLNALMLGEEEALYLGVNARALRWRIMIINTVMVATATAFVGVISFIGLVVPHLVRMVFGADHARLLRLSIPSGAILLTLSDLVARLWLAPAELPIGIVTSIVGVPVFIYLIRTNKYFN